MTMSADHHHARGEQDRDHDARDGEDGPASGATTHPTAGERSSKTMPSGQFHHPARRIFSRSRRAFVSVAFITGRVIVSRRTSRMERMRRWTRSQGCCQWVSVTRGTVAERRRGVNIVQSDIERPSGCRQAASRLGTAPESLSTLNTG